MALPTLNPSESSKFSESRDSRESEAPFLMQGETPSHTEVLKQLERIVSSPLFCNSKRYPAFLRYIVEHTLTGHPDTLKERTLGVEVFHRQPDYDTNADPVVRVTAGEIRKRLAQYYLVPGRAHELRLDLPVGSYVPHFTIPVHANHVEGTAWPALTTDGVSDSIRQWEAERPTELDPAPLVSEPQIEPAPQVLAPKRHFSRISIAFIAAALIVGVLLTAKWVMGYAHGDTQAAFWRPILHSETATLIVLGVHTLGPDGKDLSPASHASSASTKGESMLSSMTNADMVPVSDVISYSAIVEMLSRNAHPFRTQSAAATSFEQLQRGPVIFIGGLDNLWTLRLTSGLRFRFVSGERDSVGAIEDSRQPGTVWRFDNAQGALANSQDYAIVASFFDPQIEQHVLIAAGIGKSGTAAAADFLTDRAHMRHWLAKSSPATRSNVEWVISTQIVEGQQGPPHVVAEYVW